MTAACAALGAKAPNGSEVRSLAAVMPGGGVGIVKERRAQLSVAAARRGEPRQIWRSTIFSFSSAIASEGLSPFGQALAQFMMV